MIEDGVLGELGELVVRGDRWAMVHGGCVDIMRRMPDRCVDHVITDPPYENEAHTKQRRLRGRALAEVKDREILSAPLDFDPLTSHIRRASAREFARVSARWYVVEIQLSLYAAEGR